MLQSPCISSPLLNMKNVINKFSQTIQLTYCHLVSSAQTHTFLKTHSSNKYDSWLSLDNCTKKLSFLEGKNT